MPCIMAAAFATAGVGVFAARMAALGTGAIRSMFSAIVSALGTGTVRLMLSSEFVSRHMYCSPLGLKLVIVSHVAATDHRVHCITDGRFAAVYVGKKGIFESADV